MTAALVLAPASAAPAQATGDLPAARAGWTYGRLVDLQVPADSAWATRITDAGVVVGVARVAWIHHPFRWRHGTAEVLTSFTASWPPAVNESGQVLVTGDDRPSRTRTPSTPSGT